MLSGTFVLRAFTQSDGKGTNQAAAPTLRQSVIGGGGGYILNGSLHLEDTIGEAVTAVESLAGVRVIASTL